MYCHVPSIYEDAKCSIMTSTSTFGSEGSDVLPARASAFDANSSTTARWFKSALEYVRPSAVLLNARSRINALRPNGPFALYISKVRFESHHCVITPSRSRTSEEAKPMTDQAP